MTASSVALVVAEPIFTLDQIDLIKSTIAKGVTDDELKLFMMAAARLQLDPFAKQIYAVKRWDKDAGRLVMAIQVGIDGMRSAADRTGNYAPGDDLVHAYNARGDGLIRSTASVLKWVHGTWINVRRTAHWDEYVQLKKDGGPMSMWADKPHVMLGKCAEAQALRAAFPMLGGAYIPEEMQRGQDDAPADQQRKSPMPPKTAPAPVAARTAPAPAPRSSPTQETRFPVDDEQAKPPVPAAAPVQDDFDAARAALHVRWPTDGDPDKAMRLDWWARVTGLPVGDRRTRTKFLSMPPAERTGWVQAAKALVEAAQPERVVGEEG